MRSRAGVAGVKLLIGFCWLTAALAGCGPIGARGKIKMLPTEKPAAPAAVVLLLDKSQRMSEEGRFAAVAAAVEAFVAGLREDDLFSLIVFDTTPFLLFPLEPLKQARPEISKRLALAQPSGGTLLLPALGVALRELQKTQLQPREILLITAGGLIPFEQQYLEMASEQIRDLGAGMTIMLLDGRQAQSFSALAGKAKIEAASGEDLPRLLLEARLAAGSSRGEAPPVAPAAGAEG